MRQLAEHFDRSPERVSAEELRQYFIYLKTERRFSRQSSTQALCAIKLFWEKTLQRAWPAELEFARATPQFKLPVILSAAEVRAVISRVPADEQAAWQPPAPTPTAAASTPQPPPLVPLPPRCPHCDVPLLLAGRWRAGRNGLALPPTPAPGIERTARPP